jgi:hypothetical protein
VRSNTSPSRSARLCARHNYNIAPALVVQRAVPTSSERTGQAGRLSIGTRINNVCWFKGVVAAVRFTPAVLAPEQFLRVPSQQL